MEPKALKFKFRIQSVNPRAKQELLKLKERIQSRMCAPNYMCLITSGMPEAYKLVCEEMGEKASGNYDCKIAIAIESHNRNTIGSGRNNRINIRFKNLNDMGLAGNMLRLLWIESQLTKVSLQYWNVAEYRKLLTQYFPNYRGTP